MEDRQSDHRRYRRLRTVAIFVALMYIGGLVALAVVVYRATPAPPSQTIRGISISRTDSTTRPRASTRAPYIDISGRALECKPLPDSARFPSECTITIAGKLLTIQAYRNGPNHADQLGGGCEAFYNGERRLCRIGAPNLQVNWFAYIDQPLGLTNQQLAKLEQKYLIENLPENVIIGSGLTVIILTTIVAMFVVAILFWPRRFTLVRGLSFAAIVLLTAILTVSTTFNATLYVTSGLWD